MQRHIAQKHARLSSPSSSTRQVDDEWTQADDRHILDLLTGCHYDNTNHHPIARSSGDREENSGSLEGVESSNQIQARRRARRKRVIACPWPDAFNANAFSASSSSANASSMLMSTSLSSATTAITKVVDGVRCAFKFSRAYDLARHLRSEHAMDIKQKVVEEWVGRHMS